MVWIERCTGGLHNCHSVPAVKSVLELAAGFRCLTPGHQHSRKLVPGRNGAWVVGNPAEPAGLSGPGRSA
jgi:hypothetical protein